MNNYYDIYQNTAVLLRPILRYGSQGDYVRFLQFQLKQLNFYNGNIDGFFGNDTVQSVKAFQANNRLVADGVVGRDTWSALTYLYSPLPICEEFLIHTVQLGETLWGIARKYSTTVDEIMNLNNLTSTTLSIGQKLKIPETIIVPPTTDNIYIVQKGDTLWSISSRFNTTVDEIMRLNNLTSTTLSIGQQLTIPSTESIVTYIVQKGDTLYSIASRFNTTVDEIKVLNNLTTNLLSIGQVLKIPN
jgi:LysM repeat protein